MEKAIIILRFCFMRNDWVEDKVYGITKDQAMKAGYVVVER
jgi:hypothetical protein